MYSRCLMKLCRHSTRVSEKPPCQTSPQGPHSFFKRYENPPLTNCMALSTVMPSPTVTNKCRWSGIDRKSTRLNSSHLGISYAVFCLKKKTQLINKGDHIIRALGYAVQPAGTSSR